MPLLTFKSPRRYSAVNSDIFDESNSFEFVIETLDSE